MSDSSDWSKDPPAFLEDLSKILKIAREILFVIFMKISVTAQNISADHKNGYPAVITVS